MSENKTIYYQNGTFSVEDNLFYENNIRIGYFEDEEKEEIPENNHKAVVDRLTDLRDSNIDLKRSNKKLRKENKELKSLLKECKHELTSNTGLSAFDKCASYIGYVEVFDKDIIDLDYSELLEKINKMDLE